MGLLERAAAVGWGGAAGESSLNPMDGYVEIDVSHPHTWKDRRGVRWVFGIADLEGGMPFVISSDDPDFSFTGSL